ncbi:MAG: hypothetical protein PHW74_10425 [Desulfobacca sp.]|nr:hypothetical protein [Desulfobacca sp.]
MGWKFTISLQAPVCLTQNRGVGNTLPTLDYIPGSTLRGLLAKMYLEQFDHKVDDQFQKLFLNEAVSYPNLYVKGAGVIPLSALTCKYHPGFSTDPKAHGAVDRVIPWLRGWFNKKGPVEPHECRVENCRAPLERLRGYHTIDDNGGETLVNPTKRLLARTAILESREVVKPGALYTLEVLAEEQEFAGELVAPPAIIQQLKNLIASNPQGWIGTARSRGLGEVELWLDEENDNGRYTVGERLVRFNQKLHKDGRITCFTLTLESDAIVLDRLLGYRSKPLISDLQKAAGIPEVEVLNDFELLAPWTDVQRLTGWQEAWKLPKPEEQAIRRGSVFVFGLRNGAPALTGQRAHDLVAVLTELEKNGLGERPTEGFGRLRVCDEFHWENELK